MPLPSLRAAKSSLAATIRHPQFHRAPLRSSARLLRWAILIARSRPVTVSLKPFDCNLRLRPGLQNGSTWPFVFRAYYDDELLVLQRLLRAGGVFIDGGANIGIYTVVAASLVGPSGAVYAFEPSLETYHQLCENIRLNGASQVRPVRAALSDKNGERMLFHVEGASNLFSLAPGTSTAEGGEPVPERALDSFEELRSLERLDVIKLDIEGAEELALRGARSLITTHWPHILFEIQPGMPKRLGLSANGASDLLRDLGYSIDRLSPQREDTHKPRIPYGNFVAHPPRHGEAREA